MSFDTPSLRRRARVIKASIATSAAGELNWADASRGWADTPKPKSNYSKPIAFWTPPSETATYERSEPSALWRICTKPGANPTEPLWLGGRVRKTTSRSSNVAPA